MTSFSIRPAAGTASRFSIRFEIVAPLVFAALTLVHGSLLGLTDDEAYYWVLAQRPAAGYAYHPPGVAWLIAGAQALFGPWLGAHSSGLVRLPGILCAALTLGLSLRWIEEVAGETLYRNARRTVLAALLAFAGLFALSWMMVPDLPLFLGWMLAFFSTWKLQRREIPTLSGMLVLLLGCALAMVSKISGVLVAGSVMLSALLWATGPARRAMWIAAILGTVLGFVPTLLWNLDHEWASILYQLRDRHQGGGGLSLLRWGQFWAAQLVLAGPALLAYALYFLPERALRGAARTPAEERVRHGRRFLLVWLAPAAIIYGVQPLAGEFKPHWALIAWWPAAIGLALESCLWRTERRWRRLLSGHLLYGIPLGLVILLSCHVPLVSWVTRAKDPRIDVTNDLYGWNDLGSFLDQKLDPRLRELPVTGLRYQTAAQAYFALGERNPATMLPRDLKARDEWPELGVTDREGPDWPKLLKPVLFVRDNRYDAVPAFKGADCKPAAKYERSRGRFSAKWIEVWHCQPDAARP